MYEIKKCRGVAQPGSAPALGAGCRRFESYRPDHFTKQDFSFMPHAIIAQRPKSAMQSGKATTHRWCITFAPESPLEKDPIMGWASSGDMSGEVALFFSTPEEAIAFANKTGFTYEVHAPRYQGLKPKSYSDNFRSDRRRT